MARSLLSRKEKPYNWVGFIIKSFGAVLALVLIWLYASVMVTEVPVVVQVTGKERVSSEDSSKYLVFTEGETFQITDSILNGRFDSSDLYGRIESGRTYRFYVVGVRIPAMSTYRNVLRATEQ